MLVLLAHARSVDQLLLAASVPVSFSFYLVLHGATHPWGSLLVAPNHLVVHLLNVETTLVANLLTNRGRRRSVSTLSVWVRVAYEFVLLDGLVFLERHGVCSSTSVILRRC